MGHIWFLYFLVSILLCIFAFTFASDDAKQDMTWKAVIIMTFIMPIICVVMIVKWVSERRARR